MKIENSSKPLGLSSRSAPSARPTVAGAPAPSSDAVHLSPTLAQLQSSDEGAPVDSARVAEIKQAIAEGRFKIDAGAIADSLISTARDLINSQRRA